jgi:hypothetical protein
MSSEMNEIGRQTNEADENRRTAFELQQQREHRERDGTANEGPVTLDGVIAEAG